MICDKCVKKCMCATCVRNPYYVVNTPHPCIGADCDICDGGEEHVYMCNQYLKPVLKYPEPSQAIFDSPQSFLTTLNHKCI